MRSEVNHMISVHVVVKQDSEPVGKDARFYTNLNSLANWLEPQYNGKVSMSYQVTLVVLLTTVACAYAGTLYGLINYGGVSLVTVNTHTAIFRVIGPTFQVSNNCITF